MAIVDDSDVSPERRLQRETILLNNTNTANKTTNNLSWKSNRNATKEPRIRRNALLKRPKNKS